MSCRVELLRQVIYAVLQQTVLKYPLNGRSAYRALCLLDATSKCGNWIEKISDVRVVGL